MTASNFLMHKNMTKKSLLQVHQKQTIKNRASFFDHYERYLQKKSGFRDEKPDSFYC